MQCKTVNLVHSQTIVLLLVLSAIMFMLIIEIEGEKGPCRDDGAELTKADLTQADLTRILPGSAKFEIIFFFF